MKRFRPYLGNDTLFEDYPDILGIQYDVGFAAIDPVLASLAALDWDAYGEIIDKLAPKRGSRKILMKLSGGPVVIKLSFATRLIGVLDQIPTLQVFYDSPPDMGPGGSGAILVFQRSLVSRDWIKNDVERVADALACDLRVNL